MIVSGRLESLDVLRGFDMLFIMGLAPLVIAVCGALGCGEGFWLVEQMKHPSWLGLTQHDTIFPLFIFIAGVSFPFSMAKQLDRGVARGKIACRVLRRAAMLFFLGMVFERYFMGVPFRFGSVLGRIGLSWAGAALLTLAFGIRTRAAVAVAILVGYWALNIFVPAPDHPLSGVWTPQGNVVCWFDRTFIAPLGRIAPGTAELPFDNQTCLSTFPAVVTALLGVFTGEFVHRTQMSLAGDRRVLCLLGVSLALLAGAVFVAFGCGQYSFPFSKVLWSPSFTLAVGAYSVALFAVFHWLIDVRGWWRSVTFFRVIGLNSIAIYMAQPLLDLPHLDRMLFERLTNLLPGPWSVVALQVSYILLCWSMLLFLHRKKIYFKV